MFKRLATAAGILLAFQLSSAAAGPCDPDVQAKQAKAEAIVQHVKADVAAKPAKVDVLTKQAKLETAAKPAKLEALETQVKVDAAAKPAKAEALVKQAKADVAAEPEKAEALAKQAKAEAHANHRGGGNRRGLTRPMLALLDRIESKFGPVNVISGYRPGARIATTGRISRHASGNAADIDVGSRKGAIVKWLIANHHNGGTMTYSDMGHIHVDIGQHFVSLGAYSGRTGRRHAGSRYRGRSERYASSGYSRRDSDRRGSDSRSPGSYARSYKARHFTSGYATIY